MMQTVTYKYTWDDADCEQCGGNYASSYEFTVNGKTYGCEAHATCFDSNSNTLEDLLKEFLYDLGYEFKEEGE